MHGLHLCTIGLGHYCNIIFSRGEKRPLGQTIFEVVHFM